MNIDNKVIKAQIFNFQHWIEISPTDLLKQNLEDLLNKANYVVLDYIEHTFPNGGWTGLWLLAESHLAVHTFPTDAKAYIELSGCNKEKNDIFVAEFEKIML